METQQQMMVLNNFSSIHQDTYNNIADNWADPPDHGLWPISSILEHISPAELSRYLHNLQQELDESPTSLAPSLTQSTSDTKVYFAANTVTAPFTPVFIGENGRRRYQCTICFKFFTQASSLRVHGRIHTGEKPFECEICHKAFNQSGSLRLHRTVHSSDRPFSCDTCHKTFSRVRSLKLHMRTHTGRKPYKCDTCGKCFAHNVSLKIHVKLHSDERPFACDSCDKTFDQHESLVYHMRVHRAAIKPHVCGVCGKRFPTPQSLSSHGRVHEARAEASVVSATCDGAFKRRRKRRKDNDGKEHEEEYEEIEEKSEVQEEEVESPIHECNVCGKTFSRSASLRAHKISHDRKPRRKIRNRARRH